MLIHAVVIMFVLAALQDIHPMVFYRGLGLHHILSGNFGDIILDNLDLVSAYSWPGAIFQRKGTAQPFMTKKAKDNQRCSD